MVGLFGSAGASLEEQQENNAQTKPGVVISVLMMLALYGFFFTRLYESLGIPSPEDLAKFFGLTHWFAFERGEYLVSRVQVSFAKVFGGQVEREILFSSLAFVFLAVYFSPLRFKKPVLVLGFLALLGGLFGLRPSAGFALLHLLVYLCFHSGAQRAEWTAFAATGLALSLWGYQGQLDRRYLCIVSLGAPILGFAARELHRRWLGSWAKSERRWWLRVLGSYGVVIFVFGNGSFQALFGPRLHPPFFVALLCWQWMRLILYGVDFSDGDVPEDQPLVEYLSAFMNPAMIPCWGWGLIVGQSYGHQSQSFLSRDKNDIAWDGVKLLGIALCYLVLGSAVLKLVYSGITHLDVKIYHTIPALLKSAHRGTAPTATTVLASGLLHELRWLLRTVGIFHFLAALWRLFGYDMESSVHLPFMATNLVTLWARLMFHFREFLVRVFYYPAYLALRGRERWLRVTLATMLAAGLGNWLVAACVEAGVNERGSWSGLQDGLSTWPYYLLLGLGISLTELFLLKRGRDRTPWTLDRRIPLDLLAVYLTWQYYSLINVFYYIKDVKGLGFFEAGEVFARGLGLGFLFGA